MPVCLTALSQAGMVQPLKNENRRKTMTNETTQIKNTKYEVQHYTLCGGWMNSWTIYKDGKDIPQIFDTEAEAQAELYEFFVDIANEIIRGERKPDEGYDQEEFRIVSLVSGDS